MRFYKIISIIFHPIVLPTIGVFLFFLFIQNHFPKKNQLVVISLVFIFTYIIPIFLLFLLKGLKLIKSLQVTTLQERKIPVLIMILIFYFLGQSFFKISQIRDLSFLFFATSLGLICVYFLFILKIKTSLHLLSIGVSIGFFLMIGLRNGVFFLLLVTILIILSGIVATARLHLKAHTPKEVYLGFFVGFFSAISIFYLL